MMPQRKIFCICCLKEQKRKKKLLFGAQIFPFLLKALDSSGTCVRITIIICYYWALLPWEVFPNGSGFLRVAKNPNLSLVFVVLQWQNKFLIQFPVRHGHCPLLLFRNNTH